MATGCCTTSLWRSSQTRGRISCLSSYLWSCRPGATWKRGRTCDAVDCYTTYTNTNVSQSFDLRFVWSGKDRGPAGHHPPWTRDLCTSASRPQRRLQLHGNSACIQYMSLYVPIGSGAQNASGWTMKSWNVEPEAQAL